MPLPFPYGKLVGVQSMGRPTGARDDTIGISMIQRR